MAATSPHATLVGQCDDPRDESCRRPPSTQAQEQQRRQGQPVSVNLDTGAEPAEPAPERMASEKYPQSKVLFQRTVGTLLNSTHFAMGRAWQALGVLIAVGTFSGDVRAESDVGVVAKLWVYAAGIGLVVLPSMSYLAGQKESLEEQASRLKDADPRQANILKLRALAYQTLISWGLGSTMAFQINTAAQASVSTKDFVGSLLYGVVLTIAVLCTATLVALSGRCLPWCRKPVADGIWSSSAYAVALAFLGASVALLNIDNVTSSEDLGYIAIFTLATLVVATAGLAVMGLWDQAAVKVACEEATHQPDHNSTHAAAPQPCSDIMTSGQPTLNMAASQYFRTSLRKLLSKIFSLSAAASVYAFIYVSIMRSLAGEDQTSLYDPLPLRGGFVYFCITVVLEVFGTTFLTWSLLGAAERLSRVDRARVPGPFDDALLGSLQALAQTTVATVTEALAWLVGSAAHVVAMSAWDEMGWSDICKGDCKVSENVEEIGAALGYATVITAIVLVVTFYVQMPPLETA